MSHAERPLRIALVNDHMLVVRGLAAMLAEHADRIHVVELDALRDPPADVDLVLKDTFSMVDDLTDFVDAARTPVVVFAFSTDPDSIQAALDAGVAGFVHKGVSAETLVTALERAHRGERVVELGEAPHPVDGDWPGRSSGLTERESEMLTLICRGLSNQEIAQELYLSINSVKTYIRTAYRKIGAARRSQAILWGVAHGMVPRPERVRPPG